MTSGRPTFAMRIAFSAAAAVLVLAGASLNSAGHGDGAAVVAATAGLMAVAAGAAYSEWTIAAPAAGGALVVALWSNQFQLNGALAGQLAGLLLLALGGFVGITAYRSFTSALHSQLEHVEALNARLEDKHRAFVAATSDVDGAPPPADAAALTAQLANHLGASFACCYLASADGRQYVPQPPGIGLGRVHPQPLARGDKAVRLVAAVDAGRDFVGIDRTALQELVICQRVVTTGQSIMQTFTPKAGADNALNPRAVLCVPIMLRGEAMGVVFLAN